MWAVQLIKTTQKKALTVNGNKYLGKVGVGYDEKGLCEGGIFENIPLHICTMGDLGFAASK
jgi:hypothetical protein